MYLVIVIIDRKDCNRLIEVLNLSNIRSTKIGSTGGFLNSGNTTLFIGIEEEKISNVLHIVKTTCSKRESCEYVYYPSSYDHYIAESNNNFIEIEIGGAVVFVIKVEQYFRI
jgi:uncharacterized protein YaaQ